MLSVRNRASPLVLNKFFAKPNSLLARLVFWQILTSALMILGVCVTLYFGLVNLALSADDQNIEKRFLTISDLLASEAEREFWLGHEVSEDMVGPRRIFVRVLTADGSLIQETPDMGELAPQSIFPSLVRENEVRRTTVPTQDGKRFRIYVASAPLAQGGQMRRSVVQIAMDTTLDQIVVSRFQRLVALVALAALLIAAVAGVYLVMRLLAPLHRITGYIREIDHTTLDRRVPIDGLTDELSQLGGQFNDLMDRLSVAYRGLRHYADNVAHELRTPLNKMLLGLEVTLQRPRTTAQYEEVLSQVVDDCKEVNTLVDRLLFLARASSHQAIIVKQVVDIQRELESVRQYFEASASEAGVQLTIEPGAALQLAADRTLLQRAVTNLVANAIAHTPAGGEVRLAARRGAAVAEIEVRDTGIGICEEDRAHVFDRFYRADKSRESHTGRVGLGLPIAKSIVELHGGDIRIDSVVGEGTVATIALPLDGESLDRLPEKCRTSVLGFSSQEAG